MHQMSGLATPAYSVASTLHRAAHLMVRPYWPPLIAGIALGLALLLTFLITGHGLGASGFFTRLTAWLGGEVAAPGDAGQ